MQRKKYVIRIISYEIKNKMVGLAFMFFSGGIGSNS